LARLCALWAWELASSAPPAVLWHFWGVRDKRPISATQPPSRLLLRPSRANWGRGAACSPFTLVQGARGRDGGAGGHTGGLGTPSRYTGDLDPAEGVPTAGLTNYHAALVERRQRGQNRHSQPWIITKRRDVLVKGKCAFGPFLSILVIECQHKCLNVNLCPWMNKVQITSKGMFLSLSTLVLCTNIFV
jgi:hypothetical protein